MNILITGGSGFIGSHLIKKFLKIYNDIKIFSLDNYLSGFKKNEVNDERVIYIENSTVNIKKINTIKNIKFDILFHFGEYSRISTSFQEPDVVFHNNLTGTYQVLEFCRKNNCKLVYSGSSSIFGNNMKDQHSSPYSWSKSKNIELIKNYNKWFNLQFTIVYFSNVYGAGQISTGKYATVIGIFENLYKNNKKLTVVKPGTQTRDFTHIDDTIDGILKASIGYYGDGFVIRTGTQYSILQVAKMFKTDYIFIDEQKGNRTQSSGSMANMKKIGWKSKHNLKDYINNIIN